MTPNMWISSYVMRGILMCFMRHMVKHALPIIIITTESILYGQHRINNCAAAFLSDCPIRTKLPMSRGIRQESVGIVVAV